jgi:hypothetical protein
VGFTADGAVLPPRVGNAFVAFTLKGKGQCMKRFMIALSGVLAVLYLYLGAAAARDDADDRKSDAVWLRLLIDYQVGGIDKLRVPADDADIPLPRQPDGTVNLRYQTTEAKRYLGKQLFHDPIRTARININQGQPVDLPT